MKQIKYDRLGLVGRFRPLHLGGAKLLESVCNSAQHVVIGIGSCNPESYGYRNPFTANEAEDMIREYSSGRFSNYEIVHVPDFGHIPKYRDGQKWVEHIVDNFGSLDGFVSGNDYVKNLLEDHYTIIHPKDIIPKDELIESKGSIVRLMMAKGDLGWRHMVPTEVGLYLVENNLVERFRKEFGEETIEHFSLSKIGPKFGEGALDEKRYIISGHGNDGGGDCGSGNNK
jgi:nicotinamide mononucleotide adenylyltransferase